MLQSGLRLKKSMCQVQSPCAAFRNAPSSYCLSKNAGNKTEVPCAGSSLRNTPSLRSPKLEIRLKPQFSASQKRTCLHLSKKSWK
ncbi:hypothetical protein AVEN_110303-1 [Araneus ventricosus]|uniref:Uncharacterized protein n=1 Tax=Araneus ventricosus TaxID=182803 RepID=A0A4Y2SYA9_ARAVE|nr:hypothetical protein AVEN_110303-1 [Araneus ventricosus]